MGDVVTKFLRPLLAVVPSPKTDDLDGYIAVYAKVLGEFSDEALERASDTILRTPKLRAIPAPGDCLEVCAEAERAIKLANLRASRPKPTIPEQFMWTEDMANEADRLFASEWGRRAVADGVEIAMWDFLVKQQRWPNEFEYQNVKEHSKRAQAENAAYLKPRRDDSGKVSDFLGFKGTMRRKSYRLREIVRA